MDVREKLVELLREVQHLGGLEEKIADHLMANGVTVQGWVSADDRLPNLFENVLVFRDGKISIDYNEENGWFAYDLNGKRVTYWMPIPEKPEGE